METGAGWNGRRRMALSGPPGARAQTGRPKASPIIGKGSCQIVENVDERSEVLGGILRRFVICPVVQRCGDLEKAARAISCDLGRCYRSHMLNAELKCTPRKTFAISIAPFSRRKVVLPLSPLASRLCLVIPCSRPLARPRHRTPRVEKGLNERLGPGAHCFCLFFHVLRYRVIFPGRWRHLFV